MPLDPQAKALLDRLAELSIPPTSTLTPSEARAQMEAGTPLLGPGPEVGSTEDIEAPGPAGSLRLRLYRPGGPGPFPAIVYFHGGGWVIGSIETHDALCRALSDAAGVAVVSVDYRLAPEHKFPAAVEDAFAATVWVAKNAERLAIDPSRIGVGGDSAGGNLAAVVALKSRDLGSPRLAHQLLLYPITNDDLETASYVENADGYMLTRADMAWFWSHYLADPAEGRLAYASPLRAEELGGLPPAFVLTAEYDPLRDEGEAYARRLEEAGVPVRLERYSGMIHGFIRRYNLFDQGRRALLDVAGELRKTFR